MPNYERAKERLERRLERRRVTVPACASGAAAVFALLLGLVPVSSLPQSTTVIIEPVLALMLSASFSLGVRALEGPLQFAGRRREATSNSSGAVLLLLSLGCFSLVETAFLLVDVVGRWNPETAPCTTEMTGRLLATATVLDGAQRTITVTVCRTRERKRDRELPSSLNGQAPIDAGADDGAEN